LSLHALTELAASSLPTNFAATVFYQLALQCRQLGQFAEARTNLEILLHQYPEARSPSGIPWRQFARVQWLRLPLESANPGPEFPERLHDLYAEAVLQPSPLSPRFIQIAAAIESAGSAPPPAVADPRQSPPLPAVADRYLQAPLHVPWGESWRAAWNTHVTSRYLYAEAFRHLDWFAATNETGYWFALEDDPAQSWIAQLIPATQGRFWMLARPAESLVRCAENALTTEHLPDDFQVGFQWAGRYLSPPPQAAVLATATATNSPAMPEVRAAVYLKDPASFYARQRTRTFWFGSLIALSGGTVLVGFVSAWRAFRRQQQLNELKTNFVSSVSHELRSPIASVRLMAEELEDLRGQAPEKSRDYHRFMVRECRRLSALIENVLDYSRHEQGRQHYEFEPTDPAALVRETIQLMQNYGADKRLAVRLQVTGEPIDVEADGRALQQVLVNLIDNAIKHSPPEATVLVGLDFPPSDRWFRLWVADRGEGIPPEEHERIFERFYRRGSELRRETQGVGLGLAIVKYVTEAHGGRIIVESAVGQGSRFIVELPTTHSSRRP
jgi:signal transduction histidine kinase